MRLSYRMILTIWSLGMLAACNLLTIERIRDDPTPELPPPDRDATLTSFESELVRQQAAIQMLSTQVSHVSTQNAQQATVISYLATREPPPSTLADDFPTAAPARFIAGVEIEDGSCCVGGIAGDEIAIKVRFTAIGMEAPVIEMRYLSGSSTRLDDDITRIAWMPLVDEVTLIHRVPVNWTGFYIRVQYRDALGNLSPIYSDDISVEGAPPLTPTHAR